MKRNMGSIDRSLRVLIALVIAILYISSQMSGAAVVILGLLTVIFLITGFVGFCPLYLPLKLLTYREKKGTM